ncbi:helix-turn-helix domain-containing protein [uncultured Methanospirillum sp.]|uniref:winged helix-turn-helix transcriptional regulator n=1 Tax=uncultured Methanospirillum sp. TaxID=262503 RepID=UPI0029C655D5|nr:helix-turn-helix domain-containing protein [uncultured Methanospirillum sp.]
MKCEKVTKCRLDAVVDVIGSKWNLMIIWHLRDSVLRFSELQGRMCGINSKTITKHLRDLEKESIITRTVYPEVPPRVEYALTEQGRGILPIIDEMLIWGGKFRHPPEGMSGYEAGRTVRAGE